MKSQLRRMAEAADRFDSQGRYAEADAITAKLRLAQYQSVQNTSTVTDNLAYRLQKMDPKYLDDINQERWNLPRYKPKETEPNDPQDEEDEEGYIGDMNQDGGSGITNRVHDPTSLGDMGGNTDTFAYDNRETGKPYEKLIPKM